MPLILGTNSIKDTGYDVANSLRFNDDDSPMLQITPSSSATSSRKMTISFWCKRSNLGINGRIFSADTSGSNNNRDSLFFDSNDKLYLFLDNGSPGNLRTNRLFRDTSAWYHIVIAIDTTQSTDTNRVKFYVNGVQETSFDTSGDGVVYPSQNYDILGFGQNGREATIGADTDDGGNDNEFDGYLTELVFIDGQQLDPTSFGEFDENSPTIWKPIDVSGLTFGTNGFYLDFENASSLGADVSGNSNNFTVNNLTSVDQSTDTCTNNFATFNPLSKNDSGTVTFSEGNLKTAHSGSDSRFNSYSTIGVSSGKWYAEVKYEAKSSNSQNDLIVGVAYDVEDLNRQGSGIGGSSGSFAYVGDNGTKLHDSSESSYGSTFTTGDVIGIFLDLDNHKLYFSKNGSVVASGDPTSGSSGTNAAFSLDTGQTYFICAGHGTSSSRETTYSINFGSPIGSITSGNADSEGFGNFEYDPQGYFALNTKNLAEYG
jgi:hypothetical protein